MPEHDDTSPKLENLHKAEAFINGLRASNRSSIQVNGTKERLREVPTKLCLICGVLGDVQRLSSVPEPKLTQCNACTSKLAEGFTAVIIQGFEKYAWIKPSAEDAAKMGGKIVACKSEADFRFLCRLPPETTDAPP